MIKPLEWAKATRPAARSAAYNERTSYYRHCPGVISVQAFTHDTAGPRDDNIALVIQTRCMTIVTIVAVQSMETHATMHPGLPTLVGNRAAILIFILAGSASFLHSTIQNFDVAYGISSTHGRSTRISSTANLNPYSQYTMAVSH